MQATVEKMGRRPYDSRDRLIAAMCHLMSERGYTATSPRMVLDRAELGKGSLYHHFDTKQELGLAAIETMRARHVRFLAKFLDDQPSASDYLAHVLTVTFDKRDGQALVRLLADPTVTSGVGLSTGATQWLEDIRAVAAGAVRTGESQQHGPHSVTELASVANAHVTTALGEALLGLSTWVPFTDAPHR
ncbi:TetR family transcriptional regulator [Nesterenkonia alkaliphila]|uniref:TetR family transcriptional regulator n=2 Tax=Nesterenkonia alkaliphila TaxID=1463631 RepID=A0A7K1UJC2_9MICC|nr:TetR family transcriptional regulator [Nesterenkonia alkaliphila]GFZ88695.1 TetR family transcriptional regulator [Nesterenkonia alkaliphila]